MYLAEIRLRLQPERLQLGTDPALLDLMEDAVKGDDGLLDGEGEQPPHDDEEAEENVPHAGHHRSHHKDDKGGVRDDLVGQFRPLGIFAARIRLPEHAYDEDGREQDVHHGIGDEHDAEADRNESNQYRRHVQPDAVTYPGRPQADQQRQEDRNHHPAEDQEKPGSLRDEVVGCHARHDGDGDEEKGGATKQRYESLPLLETVRPQAFHALHEEIDYKAAQKRSQADAAGHKEEECEYDGAAPFATHPGGAVQTAAVLSAQLVQGLLDIFGRMGQYLQIVFLTLGEYPLLYDAIPLLGIVIRLPEAGIGALIVLAVSEYLLLAFLVKVQQGFSIEDARIPVVLALLVQQESLLAGHGVEAVNPLPDHRRAAHEAVAAERVRQLGDVPRRRQPPQRLQ